MHQVRHSSSSRREPWERGWASIAIQVATAVVALAFEPRAIADPPRDEAAFEDDAPPVDEPASGAPLWLSVGAELGVTDAKTQGGFLVAIGGTLDDVARPARQASRPSSSTHAPEPNAGGTPTDELRDRGARDESASSDVRADERPRVIDGKFARGLVAAALRAAKRSEARDRFDSLATRARASALLPEVRVRVARTLTEGEALSPTEYDPSRTTASGGTSLYVEGRATFRLDRLVFADDEVPIERMRADRERADKQLCREVLEALDAWQKAEMASHDPEVVGSAAINVEVARLAAEATLDVLSNGWFSAHVAELRREVGAVEPAPPRPASAEPRSRPADAVEGTARAGQRPTGTRS